MGRCWCVSGISPSSRRSFSGAPMPPSIAARPGSGTTGRWKCTASRGNSTMTNLYARSVFFVADAERSLRFYTEQLGFAEDWNYQEEGRAYVCQVSLLGFEVILNQMDERTRTKAGQGRVFIGLEDDQIEPIHQHVAAKG